MKKIITLGLALVLCCVSFAALGEGDGSLEAVLSKGEFILGFDAGFAPMGFTENGEYVGFDLDVAKEVCARLGVKLVLQPIDWASKDMELANGNIDCIWNGMTVTPGRAESMSLSIPYLENDQVLCVLKDSPYNALSDLAGKTVALQAGSSAAEALDAAAEFKASLKEAAEFADYTLALMDLDNKNCDAVLIDIIVANYYIAKKGADYRILSESLAPEQYAIGFRKADVALTNAVNEQLLAMAQDGALAEIATVWFNEDITIVGKAAQ